MKIGYIGLYAVHLVNFARRIFSDVWQRLADKIVKAMIAYDIRILRIGEMHQ